MAIKPISFGWTSLKLIRVWFILLITLYKEITALTSNPGIFYSADGRVRLIDGMGYASGRVEVMFASQWGTICDDLWDTNVSLVICRQLGFKGGHTVPTTIYGKGRIWLDDVRCFSNESSIFDCRHREIGETNCNHVEDISVQCNYRYDIEFCEFYPNNCGFTINSTTAYKWQYSQGSPGDEKDMNDFTQFSSPGYSMYIDSSKGKTGDEAQLSNKTGIDIDKGSITFRYYLRGDPLQILNVFIGAGERGNLQWSGSGNGESDWHFTCLTINETIKDLVITFVAVRGLSDSSAVAIDDIGISTKPCESETISCAFNRSYCGYTIISNEFSLLRWFFTFPYHYGPSTDHTTNSTDGGFMTVFNEFQEGGRTSLHSPIIQTNQSDKVEFYYYLSGLHPGELQVTFVLADPQISNLKTILWQEYGDHGIGWNNGCVDLPPNQIGKIVFTAIVGTTKKVNIAIDDISVSQGQCKKKTMKTCTFSVPQLCNYRIGCGGEREYIWKRHSGTTPTFGTGPDMDFSGTKSGFYLYAESSYGHLGDSTTVTFPVIKNTTAKYLRFWYHMYGKDIGSLQLRYHSLQSNKEEWTVAGDQGNKWKTFCTRILSDTNAFSLIAVRGSSHLGDIAIDNIQVDEQKCQHPLDCNFTSGSCNYEFQANDYDYNWMETNLSRVSGNEYFLQIKTKSYHQEVATSSLVSPAINGKKYNGSLRFSYQMYGADVNKLTIFSLNLNNSEIERIWSTNDNTSTEWDFGCINLPSLKTMRIVFMSTNGFGTNGVTRLDDFTYHHQKCSMRNLKENCNFDRPNFCDFKIKCDSSPYKWMRARSSPTHGTGPDTDHTGSFGKGYFMYAESSLGRPGDKTDLQFAPFISPPHHYLLFYYNMNGQDSGELQVNIDTGSRRTLQWSDAGDSKNNWINGCINLSAGENTTVIFTAIRGNGPLGDIAIDDVSVVPGFCPSRSLACEFSDNFLCGYKNMSDGPVWTRIFKDSGSYMTANFSYGENLMRSPIANITNSCIRVHYRVDSIYCSLQVYSNSKERLLLFGNRNHSMVGQFYIEKAQIFLQFKTKINDICEILISRVGITSGNCPSIDCPDDMVACKDQSYCIQKKWICDKQKQCLDGSDEDACPKSIACDFSTAYICGYNSSEWWWNDHDSGLMHLYYTDYNTSLISPKQRIEDTCVRFSYRARNQFSLYVLVHYETAGSNSSYTRWQLHFKNHDLSWRAGQFFLPAGNVHLEFKASVSENSYLQIDDIILLKDHCSSLNCSDDSFLCGSEEKCISEKDKCNRFHECEDKSDEHNCPSSLECDFEDNYACGYEFTDNWKLTTGSENLVPRSDHSKGHSYGHYMSTTFAQKGFVHLESPEKKIINKKCLIFFYSFQGHSQFHIYDNNFLKLIIRPSNIDTWQKSQMQLDEGVHKLRFSVFLNSSNDKLALDSISTSIGTCPDFVCEEKWKRCQPDDICVPHFKFCDYEDDCPNGYDEQNCQSFKSVRLVGGENINQGFVEYHHNGKWSGVCSRNGWSKEESLVICRELGYRGVGWNSLRTKEAPTIRSNIKSVTCVGNERSLSDCRMDFCEDCDCRYNPLVDCSNTNCSSSQIPCPRKKTEDHTMQGYKTDVCISREFLCNGEQDCPGGTDEEDCHQCNANEFQCLNKKCISTSQRCDGVGDCQDLSDEHHCFIHNGTSFFFLQDENYEVVCETNLNNQKMADKLCKAIGRSKATIGQSVSSGKGIEFTRNELVKNKFLPGLFPNNVPSCNFLNVSCKGEECGTRRKTLKDQHLQNGISAFLGQWPWQAVFKTKDHIFCGGILIHRKYVLTNAFCLKDNHTWSVTFGTINKTSHGVKYEAKRKIIQSEVSPHTNADIALLELTKPVEITNYIRPVCLPSKPWVPDMECYTTGWGTGGSYNYPYYLKEVKVHLLSQDDCISHFTEISHTTHCINNDKYQLGCLVDTGGPLVCQNQHGLWEVVGVISEESIYCGSNYYFPITYTDVYSSLNWILQHLA